MLGAITPPTAAAIAGPEPEMPPIIMATTTAITASAPRPWPIMAVAKRTSFWATPERSKMVPAKTNMGMVSSGYLAMPA